mmetsp:Transcript_10544/g.34998  ORF Transcript_10544/g.34998 Transcript_10544/m.34998 type:complete len:256 (-) Transcript_10544:207-974(-)
MGHDAALPLIVKSFPVDRLATAAVSAREIAALAHEARNHPVKSASLVVERLATAAHTLLTSAKRSEIFRCLWVHLVKKLHFDPPRLLSADAHVEEDAVVRIVRCFVHAHARPLGATAAGEQPHEHVSQRDGHRDGVGLRKVDAEEGPLGSGVDRDEFEREYEHCLWRDPGRRAPAPVAQERRHKQLPLVAGSHELQRLGPAGDHPVRAECGRLAAAVRRIEFGPIGQRALVVTLALCCWRRVRATGRTRAQDPVL